MVATPTPSDAVCGRAAHNKRPKKPDLLPITPELNVSNVARLLGCSRPFVYAEVERKKIRHVRIGKSYRFRREWIEAYLAASEVIPEGYAPATIPEAT